MTLYNTLLCCLHFGGSLMTLYAAILICVMALLLRRHHGPVNSCDWHTVQFLSEIINIRDDVFSLQSYPVTARVERYCVVVFFGDE